MDQDRYKNVGIHRSSSSRSSSCAVNASFVLLLGTLAMIVVAISSWVGDDGQSHDYVFLQLRRPLWKGSLAHQRQLESSRCWQRKCGDMEIPYPFGLFPECAMNSFFELGCNFTEGINATGEYEMGYWPFLTNIATGGANGTYNNVSDDTSLPYHYFSNSFQVLNISANTLVIETTKIKAMSCGGEDGNASISLRDDRPYRLSGSNILAAVGCRSSARYSRSEAGGDDGGSCGSNSCNNQGYYPYCNSYDCCSVSISPALAIYITGRGVAFHYFSTCGYGSVFRPDSYRTSHPGGFGIGAYGTELFWNIPVPETTGSCVPVCTAGNGSVTESPDYACALNATCHDVVAADNDGNCTAGYYCACNTGYMGDGYKNGANCADIDECADVSLNDCLQGAVCTNLPGRYSCSCRSGERGDGYKRGTGCTAPHKSTTMILGICLGVFGFWLVSLSMAISWKMWQQVKYLREVQQALAAQKVQPPIYSYGQLKVATNNFHDNNKLGEGAFGAVYKGMLADGTIVAVKQLSKDKSQSRRILQEFLNEVVLITGLRHRNLIQLKGCCIGERESILVYEYAQNGNLAESLWGKPRTITLQWHQRFNICVGVARGLSYLHEDLQQHIIHRDIKPANILLDSHFNAKIADFGLVRLPGPLLYKWPNTSSKGPWVRLFLDDQSHANYTVNIAGTKGYFAPKYITEGLVTEKLDVYSFGIVVLEMVSGKRWKWTNTNVIPHEETSLKDWAQQMHKDGMVMDILQPELRQNCIEIEVDRVIKVALICVQWDPRKRPTMSQVVMMLLGSMDVTQFLDNIMFDYNQPNFDTLFTINEDETNLSTLDEIPQHLFH